MLNEMETVEHHCKLIFIDLVVLEDAISVLKVLNETVLNSKKKPLLIKRIGVNASQFNERYYTNVFWTGLTTGIAPKYVIIPKDESVAMLISSQLSLLAINNKVGSFKTMINSTIEKLETYYPATPKDGELIETDVMEDVLNLPLVKDAMDIISKKITPLLINLDYTGFYNSASFPHINIIINSKFNHKNGQLNDPSYIFMHEIGHLLLANISGENNELPDDFWKILKYGFNNSHDISTFPKYDLLEIFADCFTIACSSGNKYAKGNPFITIVKFDKQNVDYITRYMKDYIKKHTLH